MEIRQTSTIAAQWFNNNTSPQRQTASGSAATSADTVTISEAAKNLLAAQASSAASTQSSASAAFDTSQGSMNLDIDAYFTPSSSLKSLDSLPPILLPSRENIDALTSHISDVMPQFLAQNNIPSAPSSITYDNRGEMQLPADYAYADEFKEALANNPTLEREMRTVNALTSHMVGMERALAFQKEYAGASQDEVDAIVAKYSDLFSDNKQQNDIALRFSPAGSLSLTVNGEALT